MAHEWSELTRTRIVTVYQPAIPLRSMIVYLEEDTGEFSTEDEPVLGIQVKVADDYMAGGKDKVLPTTPGSKDMEAAGYMLVTRWDEPVHDVIVWSPDHDTPVVVDSSSDPVKDCDNAVRLIAPVTNGAEWWDFALVGAKKVLLDRQKKLKPEATP